MNLYGVDVGIGGEIGLTVIAVRGVGIIYCKISTVGQLIKGEIILKDAVPDTSITGHNNHGLDSGLRGDRRAGNKGGRSAVVPSKCGIISTVCRFITEWIGAIVNL
jgi:hypothetical protein